MDLYLILLFHLAFFSGFLTKLVYFWGEITLMDRF